MVGDVHDLQDDISGKCWSDVCIYKVSRRRGVAVTNGCIVHKYFRSKFVA